MYAHTRMSWVCFVTHANLFCTVYVPLYKTFGKTEKPIKFVSTLFLPLRNLEKNMCGQEVALTSFVKC